MKLLNYLLCALMLGCFACEQDSENNNGGNNNNNNGDDPKIVMTAMNLSGVALDVNGNPIEGVTITSGTQSELTGESGAFHFSQAAVVDGRVVVDFAKDGYFALTRSYKKTAEMRIVATLRQKGNDSKTVSTSFAANTAKNLTVSAGMQAKIPASALKKADGTNFSGNVKADMFYLSPDDENLAQLMPGGDLAALRSDDSEAQLISYGMTEISLTDEAGNPLQLKDGATSELSFPIPEQYAANPPATIPLWSFNEKTGLWEEEGVATLQGNAYIGTVSHFSWHNLDDPKEVVTITGRVVDCENTPVGGDFVYAGQSGITADGNGLFSIDVPANTPVTLTVLGTSIAVPGLPGGTTYYAGDLKVPCRPKYCITIVNTCGDYSGGYFWIETASGYSTLALYTDASEICLTVPAGETGDAWIYGQLPGGGRVGEQVSLNGNGGSASLNVCTTGGSTNHLASGSATITPAGGSPVTVAISEDCIGVIDEESGTLSVTQMMGLTASFIVTVQNYSAAQSSYTTAQIVYTNVSLSGFSVQMSEFSCEDANLTVSEGENGMITLTFSGTGEWITLENYQEVVKTATVSGTITAPFTQQRINVSWAAANIPPNIPELFSPINKMAFLVQTYGSSYLLSYSEKTKADYEEVKSRFVNAGYQVTLPETTEGTETTIRYQKATTNVTVDYNPNGCNAVTYEDDNDDTVYTLCVTISIAN